MTNENEVFVADETGTIVEPETSSEASSAAATLELQNVVMELKKKVKWIKRLVMTSLATIVTVLLMLNYSVNNTTLWERTQFLFTSESTNIVSKGLFSTGGLVACVVFLMVYLMCREK